MVDYDRDYRSRDFRYPSDAGDFRQHCGAADYDRGYRPQLQAHGALAGDRRLEIVKGNVFSANQTNANSKRVPSPEPRYPAPAKKKGGGGSDGGGSGAWCFSDPEMKRRGRVAGYKAYTVEGKFRSSLRKGFRWIKEKCSGLVQG